MIKYETVNRQKFQTELNNAGIVTPYVSAIDDSDIGCEIIFAEGTDMNAVQAVVDAHNPTPLPQQPTTEDRVLLLQNAVDFILMNF